MPDTASYSVIIPSFDRAALVVQAVESVLAQAPAPLEIIVVDDGSTDGTDRALAGYGPPVRYVRQPNRGPSAARNTGIALARGDLIALLDSDDLWHPGKIAHDIALLRANPDAGMVAGDADYYDGTHLRFASWMRAVDVDFDGPTRGFGEDLVRLAKGPLCPTSTMVFRSRALRRIGPRPFDPALCYAEDWDMEFRLFATVPCLFSQALVATCRQWPDHTRPFGLPDEARLPDRVQRHDRNMLSILRRYADWQCWGTPLRAAMARRIDWYSTELERA